MRRTLIVLAGLAALSLLLVPAAGGAQPAGQSPDALRQQGRQLYLEGCAQCHGMDPSGAPVYAGVPSLSQVGGAAAIDWVLRTGRMPVANIVAQAERSKPHYGEAEIRALVAYVGQEVGDPNVPAVDANQGDLVYGRQVYATTCSACHGMNGAGSALGGYNNAPSLQGVDPLTVAEAMKIGPGQMPVFQPPSFGEREVNSIARYVQTLGAKGFSEGGLPIGGKGPVPEGFVAWMIGLGALVFVSWRIGGRS